MHASCTHTHNQQTFYVLPLQFEYFSPAVCVRSGFETGPGLPDGSPGPNQTDPCPLALCAEPRGEKAEGFKPLSVHLISNLAVVALS